MKQQRKLWNAVNTEQSNVAALVRLFRVSNRVAQEHP